MGKAQEIIERDKKVISPSLTREYEFVFQKAKDCYVWDADGKKYLDFAGGVAVANVGHTNKKVVRAIKKQLKYGLHCGFSDFYAELPVRFVETLLKLVPAHLNTAFLSNSGTESVECAYKLARWHSKKKNCIAFKPSFHGRTMGALSLTNSRPVHKERFGPFMPVVHSPYPYCYRCPFKKARPCELQCLTSLKNLIRKTRDVAAIFFEPIAGESGYIAPPKDFVHGLRETCDKYNILLCIDEVQSGCFRTGKFLAIENFDVSPDIVSLSKAIGGGLPIGVTLANKEVMDWSAGSHANTFGGNLLACAAGIAVLNFMAEKRLGENAKRMGDYTLNRLKEMQQEYEIIGDVRGIGLMIGIELVKNRQTRACAIEERKKIIEGALKQGLLLLPAGESTIRICPPLTITKDEINKGLDILEEAIKFI